MRKLPITEADEGQLRQFATMVLGISIKASAGIDTIRARVAEAWQKDWIAVDDEAAPDGAAVNSQHPHPVTDEQHKPGFDPTDKENQTRLVRIHINVTEDVGGDRPVQVGVNGKIMLIPRGKDVDIPERFYHVLTHAISYKYDPLPDGGINPKPRKVPLYPHQVLYREAPEGEVERKAAEAEVEAEQRKLLAA